METKPLLYGLIGFFIGGLIVSVAATTLDKSALTSDSVSMNEMTTSLRDLRGDEFDEAFITHMIAHHKSAVDMAKLANERAKHQEIKSVSANIISAQQKEIEQMEAWRVDWGYQAADGHSGH